LRFAAWRRPPIKMTHLYKSVGNIRMSHCVFGFRPLSSKMRPPEPPTISEVGGRNFRYFWATDLKFFCSLFIPFAYFFGSIASKNIQKWRFYKKKSKIADFQTVLEILEIKHKCYSMVFECKSDFKMLLEQPLERQSFRSILYLSAYKKLGL